MEIRALRIIRTDAGNLRRGQVTDKLSDPVAKSLIRRGLAELVGAAAEASTEGKPQPNPKSKPKGAKSSPATGAPAPEGD